MTKPEALHQFFSSFGIPAYVSSSVPDDVTFPYLTYEYICGYFGNQEVGIIVNLWYYTESEAEPNAKVEEISSAIKDGGKTIACDDGLIWVKKGWPWCQSLTDETNRVIKRRYINISLEYLTL